MFPITSTAKVVCKSPEQDAVINEFKTQAKQVNEKCNDDYVAEAVINSYFQDALAKLKEFQDSGIKNLKNRPITLQSVEDTKNQIGTLEQINNECVRLLNLEACDAMRYRDSAWEIISSTCFLGEYSYTPPSERGFLYYYAKIAIGLNITAYTFGILPTMIQVKQSFFE